MQGAGGELISSPYSTLLRLCMEFNNMWRKLRPKRGKGRWDLAVAVGKSKSAYYHRLVALSVCPCTTDGVEPYFLTPDWFPYYEIHHGIAGDTHNCMAENLFVLWWAHHRSLSRA